MGATRFDAIECPRSVAETPHIVLGRLLGRPAQRPGNCDTTRDCADVAGKVDRALDSAADLT